MHKLVYDNEDFQKSAGITTVHQSTMLFNKFVFMILLSLVILLNILKYLHDQIRNLCVVA
jgi:hypothetical protein